MEDAAPGYSARTRLLALGLMLAGWLAFNFPAFTGQVRFPTDYEGPKPPPAVGEPASNSLDIDTYVAIYPWRHLLGASLREGRIPLWDPYRFAGTPFAANILMGTWYPFNWAYAAGDILRTHTLLSVLSQLIALLGTYLFFSVLRLHPLAAAMGAILFVFSGFLTGWAAHDQVVNSAIWLPVALAGIELARHGRYRLGIPLAGASLALSLFAGHVQFTIYVWLAAGLWAAFSMAFDALRARSDGRKAVLETVVRTGFILTAVFTLAAGLAAVQILGLAEFSRYIFRSTETYSDLLATRLPFQHLATLLIPDYFGNPNNGNYVGGEMHYTELALYMGVATLLLATVGVLARRGNRFVLCFGVLGLIGVLAALGTPFYRVLYFGVPGLSRTTHIARLIFYLDFALAGLAALGLNALLLRRELVKTAFWAVPAALLAGTTLWLGLSRFRTAVPPEYLETRWLRALFFVVVGSLLVAGMARSGRSAEALALCLVGLVIVDLWIAGFGYHPFQSPRELYRVTPQVQALKDLPGVRPRFAQIDRLTLQFNAAQVHKIYGIHGYDPFLPNSFIELLTLAEDQRRLNQVNLVMPFKTGNASSPIFDLAGVTAFLTPTEGPSIAQGFAAAEVTGNDNPLPAAFVVRCWEVLPADRILPQLAKMTAPELGSVVLVDKNSSAPSPERPQSGCPAAAPAKISRYEPERVVVSTRNSGRSMLVLTDQWYPGWKATVDGRPAEILKVHHTFRGVALSPGEHTIEFRYRPGWLSWGSAISLGTALVAALACLAPKLRNKGAPTLSA